MVVAGDRRTVRHLSIEGSDPKPGRSSQGLVVSATLLLLSIPILSYAVDDAAILNLLRRSRSTTNTLILAATNQSVSWVAAELHTNFTSTLLARWLSPGGTPCRDSLTTNVTIPGLDENPRHIRLPAGEVHEFLVHAVDDRGNPRCLGGDYFETDLTGERWKSRPPMRDHGNGSYSLALQVHPQFAGLFNLTVVLLFRRFEGLRFSSERFAFERELRRMSIEFYGKRNGASELPELKACGEGDFGREVWTGRWTRHKWRENCTIDGEGRYRCLDGDLGCEEPWCYGPLGSLESNGWVYSAHCSFRLFSPAQAWQCLQNRYA